MRGPRTRITAALAALTATLLIVPVSPALAVCRAGWVDPGSAIARGYFWDVSAVDASNAWAAGVRYDRDGNERLLVGRWNGTAWTREILGFSPLYANMFAIEAVAIDDVWAAATFFDEADNRTEVVMLHYDGVDWSSVEAPLARSQRITDMVAFAPDDVWAVGWYLADRQFRPRILHWDGATWSVVDGVTDPVGEEHLFAIAGTSADDIWVAGTSGGRGGSGAIVLHLDAGGWSQAQLPSMAAYPSLADVTVARTDRAFAVGHVDNGAAPLALRWNGTSWRRMPVPDGVNSFGGVDAASARDVVTIGGTIAGEGTSYRWNGTSWRTIAVPDGTQGSLFEVDHSAEAWFVAAGRGARTSVLHRCAAPA